MRQFLIALDQLFNTLIGGMADESISARAYRLAPFSTPWHIARWLIDALFFWQQDHCKDAYFSEFENKQLPGEYR